MRNFLTTSVLQSPIHVIPITLDDDETENVLSSLFWLRGFREFQGYFLTGRVVFDVSYGSSTDIRWRSVSNIVPSVTYQSVITDSSNTLTS